MQGTNVKILSLLETPAEKFLPEVFRTLLGREPDAVGIRHYAHRLGKGLPRVLIIAEVCNSLDGPSYARHINASEIDRLLARYRLVRNWPIGRMRWIMLPRFDVANARELPFDWEQWAISWIVEQKVRAAAEAMQNALLLQQSVNRKDQEVADNATRKSLERIGAALLEAVDTIRGQAGLPDSGASLHETVSALQLSSASLEPVAWEARQFVQMLRREIAG